LIHGQDIVAILPGPLLMVEMKGVNEEGSGCLHAGLQPLGDNFSPQPVYFIPFFFLDR